MTLDFKVGSVRTPTMLESRERKAEVWWTEPEVVTIAHVQGL